MRFGGSPHASDAEVEHRAEVLNAGLLFPLDAAEVAGIVKSVNGHYRAQWRARGWHRADFLGRQQKRGRMASNQSAAGLRSGEMRRAAVSDRDRRLLALLEPARAFVLPPRPRECRRARFTMYEAGSGKGDLSPKWGVR